MTLPLSPYDVAILRDAAEKTRLLGLPNMEVSPTVLLQLLNAFEDTEYVRKLEHKNAELVAELEEVSADLELVSGELFDFRADIEARN